MTTPATPLPLLAATLVLLLVTAPARGRADTPVAASDAAGPGAPVTTAVLDLAAAEVAVDSVAADPPAPLQPTRPELRLTPGLWTQAGVTGALLLAVGGAQLYSDRLAPSDCRWCEPPQLDRWARRQLLWQDTRSATTLGNLLIVAIPVGAALTLGFVAHAEGAGFREGAEDLLVLTEAATLTLVLMQVAKFTTARVRPDAWAGSGSVTANSRMSFFAGHSAVAFAVAAAGTQVMRLRGRPGWGWFAVASFAGAAASGFFRVASDNHWLTDVVSGAVIGTAIGLPLPGLVLRPADRREAGLTLVPAPGGLALLF